MKLIFRVSSHCILPLSVRHSVCSYEPTLPYKDKKIQFKDAYGFGKYWRMLAVDTTSSHRITGTVILSIEAGLRTS